MSGWEIVRPHEKLTNDLSPMSYWQKNDVVQFKLYIEPVKREQLKAKHFAFAAAFSRTVSQP